jgi:hypothetical protein
VAGDPGVGASGEAKGDKASIKTTLQNGKQNFTKNLRDSHCKFLVGLMGYCQISLPLFFFLFTNFTIDKVFGHPY